MNKENTAFKAAWFSLATIWFGGIVSVPALLIGSTLIGSLTFLNAILTGFIGFLIVVLLMYLISAKSVERRESSVLISQRSFGSHGSKIIVGSVVGLSTLGWFGVQSNIAGASFAEIVDEVWNIQLPVWLSSVFWGLIMVLTAVFGFKLLRWLNFIAVPAIIFLLIFGLYLVFQDHGINDLLSYVPESEMSIIQAIGLTIGFISVAVVISPDYNRFAKTKRDAFLGTLFGVLPSAFSLLSIGALLAITQGTHDIVKIFANLGFPLFAMTILILATWTSNVINIYSSGLAFNSMLNMPEKLRSRTTLVVGLVGLLLAAVGIITYFLGFITLLTATVTPIAGVLIADFYFVKKETSNIKFNWKGIVSWSGGVIIMVVLDLPLKYVLGILVSMVTHYLLNLVDQKND
ncbi:MAG: cytosine permease [Ekhidna sp.]|nr:cytosine permease [Ekhidna sp.]